MLKLYLRDIDFLLANTSTKSVSDKLVKAREKLMSEKAPTSNRTSISLSRDELIEIEDGLGDLLASVGVTDGEINYLGRQVETLLDLVSDELQIMSDR